MAAFLDTNILVYVADERDMIKHDRATSLIEDALDGVGEYWISAQVLAEFSNVALKKLAFEPKLVEEYVDVFKDIHTVRPDAALVKRALQIKGRYGIQFYDAMMVAAAERSGCDEILTEDLADGQFYVDIQAHNPFKES